MLTYGASRYLVKPPPPSLLRAGTTCSGLFPPRSKFHPGRLRRPHGIIPVDPWPGPEMNLPELRVQVHIRNRLTFAVLWEPMLAEDSGLTFAGLVESLLVGLVQRSL